MFEAGIPLTRSLEVLCAPGEDPYLPTIVRDLARRLGAGSSLSQALAAHKEVFPPLILRMVHIGERTGTLGHVLGRLADYEEKRRQLELRLRSALTYPCFLAVLGCAMLLLLPAFLFGGLFKLLAQSGAQPPLLTRMVVGLSRALASPLTWVALAGVSAWAWQRRAALARLPVVSRVVRVAALNRFARALELQLQAGESPLTGLKLAAEASQHPELLARIETAVAGMRDHGDTVVGSLDRLDWFPRSFLHMLRAGEESARLPDLLGRLADVYEGELECTLEAFAALLEPFAMLVMGSIVGIIVVATMLPMMQVLQTL